MATLGFLPLVLRYATRLCESLRSSIAVRLRNAELVEELGDVQYRYDRRGRRVAKTVRFYLFTYVSGSVDDHDHEIEEARWMPLEQAARDLTYVGEREMVQRALSRSAEDR